MVETVLCPNGHRVNNNPAKHTSRNKLCPVCRAIYQKQRGFQFNLNWIREKLDKRNEEKELKIIKIRGRVRHNLRLELNREPTNDEVEKGVRKEMNQKVF
jgi:hypothetical protein